MKKRGKKKMIFNYGKITHALRSALKENLQKESKETLIDLIFALQQQIDNLSIQIKVLNSISEER